ncbi:hypothetical protein K501DRAFT_63882 [Backusella circina FSU 941]|nr:hypothetical protein K501DRAFT_63882 [Backusella circina FSU 941]
MQYLVETNILKRDADTLTKKLQKSASILHEIEKIELPSEDMVLDKETLLEDRKLLMRKLHLAELRLSARDAEIEYLHELVNNLRPQPSTYTSSNSTTSPKPQYQKKMRKGPPYLFQQQYSPRSSEIRSEQHPLSGLESLGIVADQMLSDPEFESSSSNIASSEKRFRSRLDDRRSQRSIDSAATLLAMPQLISSTKGNSTNDRLNKNETQYFYLGEPRIPTDFEQIPKKPRSTYTRWTSDEDEHLIAAVKKYGYSNWEACSRDVHGRSNIQCRNRWIRHLEHRFTEDNASTSSPVSDARQSPSIAALLNSDENSYNYSPRSTPRQLQNSSQADSSYYTPTYRPPSPIATPKGKRRSAESLHSKW